MREGRDLKGSKLISSVLNSAPTHKSWMACGRKGREGGETARQGGERVSVLSPDPLEQPGTGKVTLKAFSPMCVGYPRAHSLLLCVAVLPHWRR